MEIENETYFRPGGFCWLDCEEMYLHIFTKPLWDNEELITAVYLEVINNNHPLILKDWVDVKTFSMPALLTVS